MQNINEMWEQVLSKMQTKVSVVSYEVWVERLSVVAYTDKLYLFIDSVSGKQQILSLHTKQLKESIEDVFGADVEFVILDPEEKEEYLKQNAESVDNTKTFVEEKTLFNPKYTFDNFVVGKSNQVCYAAARAVAENPGIKLNPLFIHGGVGLGKTHLLHAIGNYLKQNNPNLKTMYVTCENFTNDYITSISNSKKNGNVEFRDKYRNLDVLMVDDIQFISKKMGTQEEFFNTFNELYLQNKQIIISSDKHVKELEILEDRLRSRFSSGFIQDMQMPDFETRVAILRKKSQLERYLIDEEVINFIAEKADTNIRVMEGLLGKIYFFATLTGKKSATLAEAYEALNEEQDIKKETLTPKMIIDVVCEYFNITEQEITGKKKSKDIVEPRMIAIYLIIEFIDLPLISIGKHFGGRDHTTIIHSRDKICDELKTNQKIKHLVNDLRKQINEIC